MRRTLLWPTIIVLSAIATVIGMLSGTTSLLRTAVTFWFVLVCPGMAYMRLLRLDNPLIEFTLAIALSITLATIVSLAQVLADAWSVNASIAILIVISFCGVILELLTLRQPAGTNTA